MAKTPKQKTMAANHKVGTFFATALFALLSALIAFPLVCGLLGLLPGWPKGDHYWYVLGSYFAGKPSELPGAFRYL